MKHVKLHSRCDKQGTQPEYNKCFIVSKITGWILTLALFICCSGCASDPGSRKQSGLSLKGKTREVLVAEAGKNSTAIVLPEKPTSSAQYAAMELQYHLEKITGEKVPVVNEPNVPEIPVKIAVGATAMGKAAGFPVDTLSPWEFMVAEKQGVIVLAGGDEPQTNKADWANFGMAGFGKPNGTSRAVFEFLEQNCNVHWYLPSEAGMVCPQTRKLVVRMGDPICRKTDYRSTSFYPWQVNSNMFCVPDTPELTGDNVPDNDKEKWRKRLWTIPIMTKDTLPVVEVIRWALRNKVGGETFGPNHSFGNWITRFGTNHPDWFSYKSKEKIEAILAKGDRKPFYEFHESGEPCFTAPGMFEQVVSDARDYFDRQQGKGDPARSNVVYEGSQGRFFSIVPNDNFVWCQCPTCKPLYGKPTVECPLWGGATGHASFYVWDFANRVARELRKTHPEACVGGIAYHDYMPPPKDLVLEPNIGINICAYQGNWTSAKNDMSYGVIRAWREQAKCQWFGVWEYFCYCAMGAWEPMFPKVCPRLLGEDVKNLYKLGVKAEFIEGEDYYYFKDDSTGQQRAVWSNPIWLYLNVWIRFKIWDDTTRDVDRLLDDHYRLFYGPAAKPIKKFFERIEARVTDMSLRGPKTFSDGNTNHKMADYEYLFPPEIMKELRGYVDKATALAANEPFKTRVGWIRMGFLEPQEKAQKRYLEQKAMTPAGKPAEGVCYRLKETPAIDGDGNDQAWQKQPVYYLNHWQTAARPKAQTSFRMGYDDTAIYFVVRCDDPDAAKIRAECKDRDSDVYLDDCVEFHLTCDPAKNRRIQIIVNSKGVIEDFLYEMDKIGEDAANKKWNCEGVQAAAKTDAKGYTVEIKIPFAGIGGDAKAGVTCYGNVCRAKYSAASEDSSIYSEDVLQSWSPTQEGFNSPKYFGRIRMAEGDGWSLFVNPDTKPPATILYKVDEKNPWVPDTNAIQAIVERDWIKFALKCPKVAEKDGRTYGGFSVRMDPPVDVSQYPGVEISFTKPNQDVMLELLYNYSGNDGKDSDNYFIMSPYGETANVPQIYSQSFAEGHETGRPAPKLLKSMTIYAVVEGIKTPLDTDFSIKWMRICK